jgi:membrane protein YqaA with SNARE-associated domain
MIVHGLVRKIFGWLLGAGLAGPFLLGVADSSFLFFPAGNDILIVFLAARDHSRILLYVLSAALGSSTGVFLLDLVCRKGGEEGLKRMIKPARFAYFKRRMTKQAGIAIAVACLAPPPFPFTIVIASASAFSYPRPRLLGIVFVTRAIRFTIIGLLAVRFGPAILRIARAPEATWVMLAFIALCTAGSVYQALVWVRRSRKFA